MPTKKQPLLWGCLTWEEIASLRAGGMEMVLLPVGATEQHGPHLGTSVDTVSATRLAEAVSAATGVPVLPSVAYGCSLGHSRKWPGTIALQPQVLIDTVVQIYDWVYSAGFRRLLMINGHVTNFAPLRCALEVIRSRFEDSMVGIRNVGELSPRVRDAFFCDAEDWHANAAETALMQALAPELVRPGKIAEADDPDRTADLIFAHPVNHTSTNGVTGFPSRASRAKGTQLFQWMVRDLSAQVRRALRESAPISSSLPNHS
ncbi:MAG: creatininase family protein [Chthoniobacteraceae bacterium]